MKVAPEAQPSSSSVYDKPQSPAEYSDAIAVAAFQAAGWAQAFTEDGYEYWTQAATGESRWAQFMEEFKTAPPKDEGLGEIGADDDFTETAWVPPSVEVAELWARKATFEQGQASVWKTELSDLQVLGAGIRLYFLYVRTLGFIFLVMSLCAIPSFLLCHEGSGVPREGQDSLSLFRTMLANVGSGPQADNGLFTTKVRWLGGSFAVTDTGVPLSLFCSAGAALAVVGWIYLRRATSAITREAKEEVVTCEDYAVFVSNVPEDEKGRSLAKYFSKAYDMHGGDWKDRDWAAREGNASSPHGRLYGEGADFRVLTTSHLFGATSHSFVNVFETSVAEVTLVFSDSKAINSFIRRENAETRLMRTRALAKMYGPDTSHRGGANQEKRERYLSRELEMTFRMAQLADKLDKRQQLRLEDLEVIGAYVIFNSAVAASRAVKDFRRLKPFCGQVPEQLVYRTNGEKDGTAHTLRVVPAPPPEDVLWENVHFLVKPWERRARVLLTSLATLAVLLLSTVTVGLVSSVAQRVEAQLPDLNLCPLSAKIPLLVESPVADDCEAVSSLTLSRPPFRSADRELFDSNCAAARERSFFVTYSNGDAQDDEASDLISYADANDYGALVVACRSECPSDASPRCPCVKVHNKRVQDCPLPIYDEITCSASTTAGTSKPLHGSLYAACYCYSIMVTNVAKFGAIEGMINSYNSDNDLCTSVFQTYSLKPVLTLIVSVITAVVNQGLVVLINSLVRLEGHVDFASREKKLLTSMIIAQVLNTVVIPLLVSSKFSIGSYSNEGAFENFMHVDNNGLVHRDWYLDVGAGFIITFIVLVLYELSATLLQFWSFSRRRRRTKAAFCEANAADAGDIVNEKQLKHSIGIVSSFAMQADLDLVFAGPSFEVVKRCTHLTTLSFLALWLGPGIPILLPMAAMAFFVQFWVDKYLLLRYFSRPKGKFDRQIADELNRYFILAILLHLLFAVWMFANGVVSSQSLAENPAVKALAPFPGGQKLQFDGAAAPFVCACVLAAIVVILPKRALLGFRATIRRIFARSDATEEVAEVALFTQE